MSTARELITDALLDLEIRSDETQLTDKELSQGIRYINRLMMTWAESGINVGCVKIEGLEDLDKRDIVPDWFELCLISHLSILLAPSYGVVVDPTRVGIAMEMLEAVQNRLVRLPQARFPNTLPIGSGNQNGGLSDFFPEKDPNTLNSASHQDIVDGEGIDLSI